MPRWMRLGVILVAILGLAAGCAGPPVGDQRVGGPGAQPGVKKRITIAIMGDPRTLSGKLNSSGTGNIPGVDALEELVHAGLANFDDRGDMRALVAEAVPSVENGGWQVFPDGRMQTTWKIKPNVFWHDGTPFTSSDLVFSARVGQDKDIALEYIVAYDNVERVEAPDPRTFTIHWSKPFIEANQMFTRGPGGGRALPAPKHILEKTLDDDKANFTEHPYWTQEYIGVGPFKLRVWERSSHLIVEANDRYLLGRPKLDEIEVKFFPDPRVLAASVLSGVIDGTMSRGLVVEQAVQIRDQWRDGKMEVRPNNWAVAFPQFLNPNPPIVGDVQMRRALFHAMDRQQLSDTLMAGLSQPAHSFLPPDDALYGEVQASQVRYDHDLRRTAQLIESLGYTKGGDGIYRDSSNQRLSVEIRATGGDEIGEKSMLTIADFWQRAGVATEPFVIPEARQRDREFRVTFPAFDVRQGPNETGRLFRFHSSRTALPENRFVGENNPRYMNPELDSLLERYFVTIPTRERNQILGQILHQLSDQVVQMGLFYVMEPTLIGNRVKNLRGRHQQSTQAWNSHEWELA